MAASYVKSRQFCEAGPTGGTGQTWFCSSKETDTRQAQIPIAKLGVRGITRIAMQLRRGANLISSDPSGTSGFDKSRDIVSDLHDLTAPASGSTFTFIVSERLCQGGL